MRRRAKPPFLGGKRDTRLALVKNISMVPATFVHVIRIPIFFGIGICNVIVKCKHNGIVKSSAVQIELPEQPRHIGLPELG